MTWDGVQMSSCRNHPSIPGRRPGDKLRMWNMAPGDRASGALRTHCGLFNSSFLFGLWTVLSTIPLLPFPLYLLLLPNTPSFSDQKKRATCIPLFTGNLLTSAKPDKGDSQPFLWNPTGDTKVSKMGKKTSAEMEHWNITTHTPWKASFLT